jgi:hypothetical protein
MGWSPNAVVTICISNNGHVGARNMLSQSTSYIITSGWFFTLHNVYDARSHEYQIYMWRKFVTIAPKMPVMTSRKFIAQIVLSASSTMAKSLWPQIKDDGEVKETVIWWLLTNNIS